MVRWEAYKLIRQRRTFLGLGAAAMMPVLFLSAILITQQGPDAGEAPFAAQLLSNGLVAPPFMTLGFGSVVLLPLLTVLVAGDAVAGRYPPAPSRPSWSARSGDPASSGRRRQPSGSTLCPSSRSSPGSAYSPGGSRSASSRWRASAARRLGRRGVALIWASAGLVALPLLGSGLRALPLLRHPQQRRVGGRRGCPDPAAPARLEPWPRRRARSLPAHQPVRRLAQPRARTHELSPHHQGRVGESPLDLGFAARGLGHLRPQGRVELGFGF